ncbi:MAG: hypothetical protein P8J79_11045 [Halioglobus sp.]|nr:hypothetical protein [Halioglobus sp.]
MTVRFDRVVIAVPELGAAAEQYQQLFATPPFIGESPQGQATARWGLRNTVIEVVQGAVAQPCVQGVILESSEAESLEEAVPNGMGLDVRICGGHSTADFRQLRTQAQCMGLSVDHVVLRTSDAPACIKLFADELGVRLALDKTVPEWGGRMLFFRAGKMTLEVIESDKGGSDDNAFWGLAYQCADLASMVSDLIGRGVKVSTIREGRKPRTFVATVKSHALEIPTLLIQPAT